VEGAGAATPGVDGKAVTVVIDVTDESFAAEVLASPSPVVVDFWAPWCRPCKAIEPILRQLVAESDGRLRLARVNVDENVVVATRYGVLSLPTVILFADGQPRETVMGATPRKGFERAFADWL
jgi:thioredoxin 1